MFRLHNPGIESKIDWLVKNGKLNGKEKKRSGKLNGKKIKRTKKLTLKMIPQKQNQR